MEEMSKDQPLSDLRVLDLTHGIAGPYCTKLLADFGANVIKVERPDTGDFARSLGPFSQDIPHLEKSGLFLYLNTNKRGIVLDLKAPQGVETVKALVTDADILVENFRPGVMAQLGLDYETLSEVNTNLVMTSISNFGQTGPYRDYLASELTLFAMGGRMSASGLPDRYPLKLGGNHVQYQAGNVAAMATLFAWYAQRYQGMGGQHVDVSIFETQMASINSRMPSLLHYQYTGERGRRFGPLRLGYPSGYYPCQDGYISVMGAGPVWPRTVAMLGMPELLNDPRFGLPLGQLSPEGKEEFEATIWFPWLMSRTKRQVIEECQAYGVLSGPIDTTDEVMDHNPQLQFREYFVEVDHPSAGNLRYPGAPIYAPRKWWQINRPAPLLGQHTQEVLDELKRRTRDARPTTSPGPQSSETPRLPLDGIRIIDSTVVWAGTYGTMFPADMGAEVIRVESVNIFPYSTRGLAAHPDPEAEVRLQGVFSYPGREPGQRPWNRHAIFNVHARNKYSMTLNLNTPEGRDVFRRLVQVSDVFIENNGVGSMARLGLTYSTVSDWNPRLVMISSTGFGQTGPWSEYRGIGSQFEGAYVHASVIGYPDMDIEGTPGTVASDASTGVTIALATVMALHHREKTGKGVYIDISMGENFLPHLGELLMDYSINRRVAHSQGNRDSRLVQGVYQCSGDDEWVAMSIAAVEQWHALCRVMGRPELIEDQRFATMEFLHSNHDDVDKSISDWTKSKDTLEVFQHLQKAGVVAGPLLNEPLAYADPHLKEREFFTPITQEDTGTHLYPGTVFKMSKVPFVVRKPPVRLGEDNDYCYREVLKLSEAEYDQLKTLGHIGMDYAPGVP